VISRRWFRPTRDRNADHEVNRVMTEIATTVVDGGDGVYDFLRGCSGLFTADTVTLFAATHAGSAYVLWAKISDLDDHPAGPQSEDAMLERAVEAAVDWLTVNTRSERQIRAYFARWKKRQRRGWWEIAGPSTSPDLGAH
jgi:hypothetical protein